MNFNNINNDIDWYAGNQIRDNVLHDSPLFPRQINFRLNKNLEISSSVKKIQYCYDPSNITKKNLSFGSENNIAQNNIITNNANNFNSPVECNNKNFNNFNYTNNFNFEIYQPKKLFINNINNNNNGNQLKFQQEKIQAQTKIIMSSDDERDETKNTKIEDLNNNKNLNNEIKSKKAHPKYPLDRVELKDNKIINSVKPNQNEYIRPKRESSRKKLKKLTLSSPKMKIKKKITVSKKKSKNISGSKNKSNPFMESKNNNLKEELITSALDTQKTKCTCSKTQCLKKYCECFSNGRFCVDCECENCLNIPENIENLNEIRAKENNIAKENENTLEKINNKIVCNCTKSGCRKKYCECFKAGKDCSEECRCIHCDNMDKIKISNLYKKHKTFNSDSKNFYSKLKFLNFQHDNNLFSSVVKNNSKIKGFDNSNLSLFNLNLSICGEQIEIEEKNEILSLENIENYSECVSEYSIIDYKNIKKRKTKNKKIKKRNNKKNIVNNDVDRNIGILKDRDLRKNSKENIDILNFNKSIYIEENEKFSSRRSARLKNNNKNFSHSSIGKFEKTDVICDLSKEFREANLSKNNNDSKINNDDIKVTPSRKKNFIKRNDDSNSKVDANEKTSNLNFFSSVVNKESLERVDNLVSNKYSILNNCEKLNLNNIIENDSEIENNNLHSNRKNKYSKLNKLDSCYSNVQNSNKKEQSQKLIETPKLCEKKRYRNTTSGKPRTINEEIYMKTNSTMNQTPIINNDKNIKKKHIEVDRRIVKNLQSKYY